MQEVFQFLSISNEMINIFGYSLSYIETIAVLTGLWCVILFNFENIWAFPIGLINSVFASYLLFQCGFYADLFLQIYYIALGFIGWYMWNVTEEEIPVVDGLFPFKKLTLGLFVSAIVILTIYIDPIFNWFGDMTVLVLGIKDGYAHVPATLPLFSAVTTIVAMVANWLLIKKYRVSWLLWSFINILFIGMYIHVGLFVVAFEYFIFLVNAIIAYNRWAKIES